MLFVLLSVQGFAQTGIGTTTPNASAKLEVASTDKGFLLPRMTAAQRSLILTPANGLLVYQTDSPTGFYVNTGTSGSPVWTRVNMDWTRAGNDVSYSGGNVGIGTITPTQALDVNGNVKATNFLGTATSATLYLLEAYANVTYLLPGSYTDDICRYSVVNTTINVPSSWFNTSTYRFTPQKAGYWEIGASYNVFRDGEASLALYKNGINVGLTGAISATYLTLNKIIYLNGSTDYINIYNNGFNSNSRSQGAVTSWFQARWVGE